MDYTIVEDLVEEINQPQLNELASLTDNFIFWKINWLKPVDPENSSQWWPLSELLCFLFSPVSLCAYQMPAVFVPKFVYPSCIFFIVMVSFNSRYISFVCKWKKRIVISKETWLNVLERFKRDESKNYSLFHSVHDKCKNLHKLTKR